jgi:hypothetical protein
MSQKKDIDSLQFKPLEETILQKMQGFLSSTEFEIFQKKMTEALAKNLSCKTLVEFIQKFITDNTLDVKWEDIAADWNAKLEKTKTQIKKEVTEEKKKEQLQYFILNSAELPQVIDQALGKILIDGKYLRYYGAYLRETIEKEGKKGPYTVEELSPAMVLEDRRIITHRHKWGIKFDFGSKMTIKHNRWEDDSIHAFITQEIKAKDVSFATVHERIRKHYEKYMVFEHDEWYDFNALWDQCTYYHDLIDKFLFIKHEGMSGAAKSKGMKISAQLSFNGRIFLKPNPANFFRFRHHNKATLYFEEAERLFDDTKKGNQADDEMVEYLNGSYEKGNTVPRQDDNDRNLTLEFDPAGFSRIGSIKPLKGALEKRSVTLYMIKAGKTDQRSKMEVPMNPVHPDYLEFRKTRNLCYLNGLLNYKQFEEALALVDSEELIDRHLATAKPLLAMAHCIDPAMEKRIVAFLVMLKGNDEGEDETSWNYILADTLLDIGCRRADSFFLSNTDLHQIFLEHLRVSTGDSYAKISPRALNGIMKNLGFGSCKGFSTDKCQRGYRDLGFFKICEYLLRNETLGLAQIIKKVSEVSNCPHTVSDIKIWYYNKFNDTDTSPDTSDTSPDTSDGRDTYIGDIGCENFDDSISPDGLKTYLLAKPEVRAPLNELAAFFDVKFLGKMKEKGLIFENPAGMYNLNQ